MQHPFQLSRLDHLALIRSVSIAQRRCLEDLSISIALGDDSGAAIIANELTSHARALCSLSSEMWPFEDEETEMIGEDLAEVA